MAAYGGGRGFNSTFDDKNGELWSTNKKVYAANVYPPKINNARDLGQLYISTANILGTDQALDKRKSALSTTISFTFEEKKSANFGPLTKPYTRLMFTHPKCTLRVLCRLMQLQVAFWEQHFSP